MKKMLMAVLSVLTVWAFAVEIPLRNAEFKPANGKIPFWRVNNPEHGSCEAVPLDGAAGKFVLKLSSTSGEKYFGAMQYLDYKSFPKVGEGEMLQFKLTFRQKDVDVNYGGFANFSAFNKKGYIAGADTDKISGSFDWKEVTAIRKFKKLPDDLSTFTLTFYLGKTTGTVYFADPKLEVEVVKQ